MRPYLAWKGAEHRPLRLYAVGHSHLDLAWLWPLRETRRKAGRTFSTALANMAAYPSYVYGASQRSSSPGSKRIIPPCMRASKRR